MIFSNSARHKLCSQEAAVQAFLMDLLTLIPTNEPCQ